MDLVTKAHVVVLGVGLLVALVILVVLAFWR